MCYDKNIRERVGIMRKTVVITGATDGIGKALAVLLSNEYDLILCGRNETKMNDLLKEVGNSCVYYECFDIIDDQKRNQFCETITSKCDHIDVLVNNAELI